MQFPDCEECRNLLHATTKAASAHFLAISKASMAAEHGSDPEFDALHEDVLEARDAQLEAYRRYEEHIGSHNAAVRSAEKST